MGDFVRAATVFGSTTLTNTTSITFDPFVVKVNHQGDWEWTRQPRGMGHDYCLGVTATRQEQLYITGSTESSPTSAGALSLTNQGAPWW